MLEHHLDIFHDLDAPGGSFANQKFYVLVARDSHRYFVVYQSWTSHGSLVPSCHFLPSFFKLDIVYPTAFALRFRTVSTNYLAETVTNRHISRFVSFLFFDFKKSQNRMRRIFFILFYAVK